MGWSLVKVIKMMIGLEGVIYEKRLVKRWCSLINRGMGWWLWVR